MILPLLPQWRLGLLSIPWRKKVTQMDLIAVVGKISIDFKK